MPTHLNQYLNSNGFRKNRSCLTVITITLCAVIVLQGKGRAATFVDVTSSLGLDNYAPTSVDVSVAWGDYNNDGWIDLYIGSYDNTQAGLFENRDATWFVKLDSPLAVIDNLPGVFVDYDNNAEPDVATAMGGMRLARNNADGTFTAQGGIFDPVATQSEVASWGDFNGDGLLDVYRTGWEMPDFTPYADGIFINTGSHFSLAWEGPVGDLRNGRGVTSCDYDEDGDLDVYVSNYRQTPNFLWQNDGTGSFTDVAVAADVAGDVGVNLNDYGHTIGSAWGDLDNDGDFDLVAVNLNHNDGSRDSDDPKFYKNLGAAGSWTFEDMTATVAMPWVESHASPALGDFDNDGDLDVFVAAVSGSGYPGDESTLMCNDGNWNFTDCSDTHGLRISTGETNFQAAWGDYDNDGKLDLYTGRKLYRNTIINGNSWLKVRLKGDGVAMNRDAIGAQVRIHLGGGVVLTRQVEAGTGWGNQQDPWLHFGLGTNPGPVSLDIIWPNGSIEMVDNVAVDQDITVQYIANLDDGNLSFERPDTYVVPPAVGVLATPDLIQQGGAGWDFVTNTGITHHDGPFINGAFTARDGDQLAYLQAGNNEIAQNIDGFQIGRDYTIGWDEARRPSNPDPAISQLEVLLDVPGTVLMAAHDVLNEDRVQRQWAHFTATLSTHRLRFRHTIPDGNGLDVTTFVDDVLIREYAVPVQDNMDFELPDTGFEPYLSQGMIAPLPSLEEQGGAGWDGLPLTGITDQYGLFIAGAFGCVSGTQCAYLQTGGTEIAQYLRGFELGMEYTISWWEARRPGNLDPTISQLWVLLDADTLMPAHDVTSETGFLRQSVTFTATRRNYLLRFFHIVPGSPGTDVTVFVDKVVAMPAGWPAEKNPDFESPDTFQEPWLSQGAIAQQPTLADQGGSGWEFVPLTGITSQYGAFVANAFPAASGTQFAYLQTGNKEFAQTYHGFTPGRDYEITWHEARRPGNFDPTISQIQLLMDVPGVEVMAPHDVTSESGFVPQSATFTATDFQHRLRFYHIIPGNPGADVTVFVDSVQVKLLDLLSQPGDCDGDRDVDQVDFACFQRCYTGTGGGPPETGCEIFEFSGDDDINETDLIYFSYCASGPGIEADPDCLLP